MRPGGGGVRGRHLWGLAYEGNGAFGPQLAASYTFRASEGRRSSGVSPSTAPAPTNTGLEEGADVHKVSVLQMSHRRRLSRRRPR
ncbi:hypothetical protein GN956_G8030 [Arapaima gigas]